MMNKVLELRSSNIFCNLKKSITTGQKQEVCMVTKQRFTGFLIITALVLLAPSVYADNSGNFASGQSGQTVSSQENQKQQGCPFGKGHRGKQGHKEKANKLNLTDVQKKQLTEKIFSDIS